MRFALATLALLTLAACDASAPEDALVGTWTLTSVRSEVRVTSRTAQTLPDLTATPTSTVNATGAVSATLSVVDFVYREVGGHTQFEVRTPETVTPSTELYLFGSPSELNAQLNHGQDTYFGLYPNATAFTRSGGVFTVPSRTLVGTPESRTVTVGGTVTYPEIALAAGQSIDIQPYEPTLFGTLIFTFGDDGGFTAQSSEEGATETVTGTWALVGEDLVRVSVTEGSLFEAITFGFTTENGALVLTATNLDDDLDCTAECLAQVASELFAEAGSLSSVDYLTTYRFGSRAQAAARMADDRAPTRLQRRATLPIVGPLLSRTRD